MAFNYLAGSSSISDLIFNTILKINPSLLYKYTSVADQALYLILIPTALILLFSWTFGYWFMGKGHNGLRIVISGIVYIYIVYSGWYGSFIVPILLAWFPLIIISYFAFFIFTKILHPGNLQGASTVLTSVFDKATSKSKDIQKTEKDIELLTKQIEKLRQMQGSVKDNDKAVAEIISKMANLEQNKIQLEAHLRKIGG